MPPKKAEGKGKGKGKGKSAKGERCVRTQQVLQRIDTLLQLLWGLEVNMEAGGELDDAAKARLYQLTCQSLQLQLGEKETENVWHGRQWFGLCTTHSSFSLVAQCAAERTEEATRAVTAKRELTRQVEEMKQQIADDEQATFELTQDMTRQYKGMQEELLSRVSAAMGNARPWNRGSVIHGRALVLFDLFCWSRQINDLEDVIQKLQDKLEEAQMLHSKQMREKEEVIRSKEEETRVLKAKMEDMADEFAEMLRVRCTDAMFWCCVHSTGACGFHAHVLGASRHWSACESE